MLQIFPQSDRDLIGVQSEMQRLTFLASTSDFEETVRLSQALLHRYGKFTMHSRLVDSHIYVIKKWVVDYLQKVRKASILSNYPNYEKIDNFYSAERFIFHAEGRIDPVHREEAIVPSIIACNRWREGVVHGQC